jgi:ElaB/YqjD/DUF883 family membrane-anchored ribosome-binding protein
MSADPVNPTGQEALASAERRLAEAARLAERLLERGLAALRHRARPLAGPAVRTAEDAQRFLVERVKARPVTALFAGLGAGILLGLLLSGRGK